MFPSNKPTKKTFALESGTIPGQPNNKKIKTENDKNNNTFTLGTFEVEIPSPSINANTATLSLDNTAIDLVQKQYLGHLELPDRNLNPIVQFNTNGYNYATSLDIDLSNVGLQYNLEPGQVLTQNNTTYDAYDYEKDDDMDLRPQNQRNIVYKSRDGSKSEVEDDPTYRNIGSFRVEVPTPQPRLETISGHEYTSNGNYGIRKNWGYDGIESVDFRINVPQTLYTYPTITTNGTYIIPENYVGLNVIKVNIDPNNPNPPNPPAKPTKEATDGETIMQENNTWWSGLRRRNSNGEYITIGDISRNFNGIYINNWSSPEYNTYILSRYYGTGMMEVILFTLKMNIEANYPISIVNDLTNEYTYRNEWTDGLATIYGMYSTDTPSYHTYPGFTTYGPVNDVANFDSSSVNVSSLSKTTLHIEVGTD